MKCTRRKLEFFVVLVRGKKGSRFAPSRGLQRLQRTIEDSQFCSFFWTFPRWWVSHFTKMDFGPHFWPLKISRMLLLPRQIDFKTNRSIPRLLRFSKRHSLEVNQFPKHLIRSLSSSYTSSVVRLARVKRVPIPLEIQRPFRAL